MAESQQWLCQMPFVQYLMARPNKPTQLNKTKQKLKLQCNATKWHAKISYHGETATSRKILFLQLLRIVGDDDGGVLFTPEQYEAYKKKVIPQRMRNRLFVSWASPNGIECKMVGPETMCFCRHR